MKKEKANKVLITVMVVSILVIFGSVIYVLINENNLTGSNSNSENNEEKTNNNNVVNNDIEIYIDKYISLNKEEVSFEVDERVKLKFVGIDAGYDMDDDYTYVMELTMDNKVIKTDVFDNIDNQVIYSDAFETKFRVLKINDMYIFIEMDNSNYKNNYMIIVNSKGNVIESFGNIEISLDLEKNKLQLSRCITDQVDGNCWLTTFEFKKSYLNVVDSYEISKDETKEFIKWLGSEKLGLYDDIENYNIAILNDFVLETEQEDGTITKVDCYRVGIYNEEESKKFLVTKNGLNVYFETQDNN